MLDAIVRKALRLPKVVGMALMLGAASPAYSAMQTGLLIWPVTPNIQSSEKAEALWLENTGRAPMTVQVRVFGWTQSNYQNQFGGQRMVIPSPPMARIEPGQKQLVRLIRAMPIPAGREEAFRVQLDEVPIPEVKRTVVNGLAVLMRYSIPLYAYGDGLVFDAKSKNRRAEKPVDNGAPKLSWKIVNVGGKQFVEVSNTGNVHAQLSRAFFNLPNGKQIVLSKSGVGAVLAGSSMRWPLPAGVSANSALTMKVNRSKDNLVIDKAY